MPLCSPPPRQLSRPSTGRKCKPCVRHDLSPMWLFIAGALKSMTYGNLLLVLCPLYFSGRPGLFIRNRAAAKGRVGFWKPAVVRAGLSPITEQRHSTNFRRNRMRAATVAALFFALGSVALAKDPPAYEKAVLVKMDSSACGYSEKDGKTIAGEIFGTDGQHKNTKQVLCQEYVLQTDRVTYRIQPKDDKHPVLLPVGETAQFRIHKDKMLLRVPEADGKEREYLVL